MDYTGILSRAWKITWKHKILWIFGILSGCGQGGGGNNAGGQFNAGGQGGSGNVFEGGPFERFVESPEFVYIAIGLAILAILVVLVVFVLSIIGRGGLIGGAKLAAENGAVTFGAAWAEGLRVFWRMLGIGLLVSLPLIVVVILAGAGAVLTAGIGLICLIPLVCLVALAVIPLSVVAHFAQFEVVFEDVRAVEGFRRGWELLKKNLGPILILGAILFVAGIVASLILSAPLILLVVPVMLGVIAGEGQMPSLQSPLLIGAGIGFVCYLPILIVLSGILQTWVMSAWTLAYRQLTGREATPGTATPPEPPLAPA